MLSTKGVTISVETWWFYCASLRGRITRFLFLQGWRALGGDAGALCGLRRAQSARCPCALRSAAALGGAAARAAGAPPPPPFVRRASRASSRPPAALPAGAASYSKSSPRRCGVKILSSWIGVCVLFCCCCWLFFFFKLLFWQSLKINWPNYPT